MSRQFIVLVMLFAAGWLPQGVNAQDTACSQYSIPIVIRDARGEVIHGFSREDLEVKVDGKFRGIDSIHREDRPRHIVIVLDASGSMKGIGNEIPWHEAIASVKLLASSEGRAYAALLIFNTKIVEEIGFARDNSAVTKRLGDLSKDAGYLSHSVKGTTHLYDAMSRALQLLEKPNSADALYVVSDGGENGSKIRQSELQRALAKSGVRVFFTLLHIPTEHRIHSAEEEIVGPNSFELTQRTGGGFMYLGPAEIRFGFEARPKPSLSEGIRMFFGGMFENEILQVTAPNQVPGKHDLKITLSAAARDRLKGAQLFYPQQRYSCAVPQGVSNTH